MPINKYIYIYKTCGYVINWIIFKVISFPFDEVHVVSLMLPVRLQKPTSSMIDTGSSVKDRTQCIDGN
jgi:hypothetical protein